MVRKLFKLLVSCRYFDILLRDRDCEIYFQFLQLLILVSTRMSNSAPHDLWPIQLSLPRLLDTYGLTRKVGKF